MQRAKLKYGGHDAVGVGSSKLTTELFQCGANLGIVPLVGFCVEIVKDFKRFFGLYAGLAVEALKSGLYLDDKESYEADDWSGAFDE